MSTIHMQQDEIRDMALEGLRRLSDGESAFRVSSDLYREHVSGATLEEAEQCAGRIAEAVRGYEAGRAGAEADVDGWLDGQLDRLAEERSLPGRCAAIAQATAAIRAADGAALPGAEADYSNATEADEARLRADFAAAARQSRMYDRLVEGMAEGFEAFRSEEDYVEIAAREGGGEALKAVLATALCVQTVNEGEQEVPPEVPALCACAGMDAMDCARGRMLGKISPDEAQKWKEIVYIVLCVLVIAALVYAGVVLLPQLPKLIPASVLTHVRWLEPTIKTIGRSLPIFLFFTFQSMEGGLRNAASRIVDFFSGRERVSAGGAEELPLEHPVAEEEAAGEEAEAAPAADCGAETASESALADA